MPSPIVLTAVATSVARERRSGAARSSSAAVAVPVKMPADRPDTNRPTNSTPSPCASRNTIELAALRPKPGSRTWRRPYWSES